MPLPEAKKINVGDLFSEVGQEQYHLQTINVGAGLADIWSLVAKLLKSNMITDALTILDMWTNDGKYTLAQFKGAIREALSKLGINLFDPNPVAPRNVAAMLAGAEEGDEKVMRKRPTKEEVIEHLVARGVDVKALNVGNPALLWTIIQLALQFGLPLIETIIDRIINKQAKHEKLTFADLV